jgi:hypothetical protein
MTGRNFLLPSPRAWAFLSVHAVPVLLPSTGRPCGGTSRASEGRRVAPGQRPPALEPGRVDRGSTGPQDLLERALANQRQTRPPCAPCPPPSRGAGVPLPLPCRVRAGRLQATPEQQAARVSVMVKIGSKAPANVRTFFPRPPRTVSPGTQEHRTCARSSR